MRGVLLSLVIGILLSAGGAYGQGGFRLILWNLEPVEEDGMDGHYGLGYDHDLNSRLSLALTARYALNSESIVLNYWSAYHLSDNDRTSIYIAPMVGVRVFSEGQVGMQVPLGLRMGVRGGLRYLYVDLYAGVHYSLGSSGKIKTDTGYVLADLRTNSFCIGVDVGFGWGAKKSKS